MSTSPIHMRDAFIDRLYEFAKKDPDVVFISADFGAPALDRFREDLSGQFIHSGISEQHMIDMAGGLAISGKKVYTYAMAPFISLRCLEQVKCSLSMMELPVTILSVGIGLGYADSGPTHYTMEDFACLRSFPNVEVWTPGDSITALAIAELTYEQPALRYIRMDRSPLADVHTGPPSSWLDDGFAEVKSGGDVCIVSCGYMLHQALQAHARLKEEGIDCGIVDLFRVKPIDGSKLAVVLAGYKRIITVEEQVLSGGLGSAVLEILNDAGKPVPVHRMGLADRYYFENGGRDRLLEIAEISPDHIYEAVQGAG